MNKFTTALALAAAVAMPTFADAGQATLLTQLKSYGGAGAYLAFYITDSNGKYTQTLFMSGGKTKYYKHLSDWSRASGKNLADAQGVTGASTGSGKLRVVSIDLSNALMDAGYELHIDAAVEDFRDSPSEIVVPLTRANLGKAFKGRRYIKSFKLNM